MTQFVFHLLQRGTQHYKFHMFILIAEGLQEQKSMLFYSILFVVQEIIHIFQEGISTHCLLTEFSDSISTLWFKHSFENLRNRQTFGDWVIKNFIVFIVRIK